MFVSIFDGSALDLREADSLRGYNFLDYKRTLNNSFKTIKLNLIYKTIRFVYIISLSLMFYFN